ncbi:ethanolamine ammonia-lyase subunit EutC [Tropicimonas sp. IMCC34043]|uniref:ethanolamine ammonia-lyase subunit EutC n=1 Tax=Tropicimonas sp. IMCC34043 TaxID=2248760 RepID=UPI000E248104|nr:ethanolamine ammonia-lyase subunit EutC [Tropicimonas sp. IMCC34043]
MKEPTRSTRFDKLRRLTPSRVRFDASDHAPGLDAVLDFQASHARARDAIHRSVDWDSIIADLAPHTALRLESKAGERKTYLSRPDFGRELSDRSLLALDGMRVEGPVVVLADGLSSFAVQSHGAALFQALTALIPELGNAPVFLVEQARVAIADQIGASVGATATFMLIGERPGLSVSDSLGAYFTWAPDPGLQDSRRNCVSNIHANDGLSIRDAAARLAWVWQEARKLGTSGVTLKDMSGMQKAIASERSGE